MNLSLFPSAAAIPPRVSHLEQIFRPEVPAAPLVSARMGELAVDVHDPGLARAFVAVAGVAFGVGMLVAVFGE